MDLGKSFAEHKPLRKGLACDMCRLILTLDESNAASLRTALDDPNVAHTDIESVLRGEGLLISSGSIGRHRRQQCRGPVA